MKSLLIVANLLLIIPTWSFSQTILSPLFTDHMVLQRDQPLKIWGEAKTGSDISINLAGKVVKVTPDMGGHWMADFQPFPAGGPHTMKIESADTTLVLKDIWMGDVWLCSGQSNMEWIVSSSNNAAQEIATADDGKIRHFKVPHGYDYQPSDALEGGPWEVASPEHVGRFTAVGYFFAREVRKHHDVAIGLLNSSWGGSRIEPWMEAKTLGYDPANFAADMEREIAEKARARRDELESRLGELPQEDIGLKDNAWAQTELDDSDWQQMDLPGLWEEAGYPGLDGIVWYRKEINLESNQVGREATLHLQKIDDSDITYVNGQQVGAMTQAYSTERAYTVGAEVLRKGKNVITVRVEDTGGGGGVYGIVEGMKLDLVGSTIPLSGAWKFKIGKVDFAEQVTGMNHTPTVLYNKMINPLLHFSIAGVLWYQGESNASMAEAHEYRDLFKNMIADWRAKWQSEDLPFFHVQLANFRQPSEWPSESGWALLRESQTAALELKNTAEAVIIDIGEADDIHPRNKQDVGHRLSLAARNLVYGEDDLVFRSPSFDHAEYQEDGVLVHIDLHGSDHLEVHDKYGYAQGFAIAGKDRKWRWAQAKLVEGGVWVHSDLVKQPIAVRYAWGDNPDDANVYNAEGLPMTPFRTDDW